MHSSGVLVNPVVSPCLLMLDVVSVSHFCDIPGPLARSLVTVKFIASDFQLSKQKRQGQIESKFSNHIRAHQNTKKKKKNNNNKQTNKKNTQKRKKTKQTKTKYNNPPDCARQREPDVVQHIVHNVFSFSMTPPPQTRNLTTVAKCFATALLHCEEVGGMSGEGVAPEEL